MDGSISAYKLNSPESILTPALLIYPELVDRNITATLRLTGGNASRWRPHIKTAKLSAIIRQMIGRGVRTFKCSTTLELLTACEAGAEDVLLAFAVTGANARRTVDIARQFPGTHVSVLIESAQQLGRWAASGIGIFIDVNPGMNRTGIGQDRIADICALAQLTGGAFRGIHYYDGQIAAEEARNREAVAWAGYDRLIEIVKALEMADLKASEVITSGTPAAPYALSHAGLGAGSFQHRISPGTVIYNDMTSLEQLPGLGYVAAALVLSTVISHPAPGQFTCDAGHKSVSADSGVPTCRIVGHDGFTPLRPSEEHLPVSSGSGEVPKVGSHLYLMPRHVCPTVNNFDEALIIAGGEVRGLERVTARGHESGVMPG